MHVKFPCSSPQRPFTMRMFVALYKSSRKSRNDWTTNPATGDALGYQHEIRHHQYYNHDLWNHVYCLIFLDLALTLHWPFLINVRQCSLSIKRYVYCCHTGQAGLLNVFSPSYCVEHWISGHDFGLWIKNLWVWIRLKHYSVYMFCCWHVYLLHKRWKLLFFQISSH